MNVGIIGASGRIGQHVLKGAIQNNWKVHGLSLTRELPNVMHPNIMYSAGDIRQPEVARKTVANQQVVVVTVGTRQIISPHTLHYESLKSVVDALSAIQGVHAYDVRLIAVLGAGILDHPRGVPLGCLQSFDAPTAWLEDYLKAFDYINGIADLNWTLVCPAFMSDEKASGNYRVAANSLPEGGRCIGAGDVADFILKEITCRQFIRSRVGITY